MDFQKGNSFGTSILFAGTLWAASRLAPFTMISCGGKFSSRPGMTAAFSTTTPGSPLHISNSTRMPLKLALAPISQAHGFTGPSKTMTFPFLASIAFKELYAIAIAVHTWSSELASRNILFHCDNSAVVHALCNGTSRCRHIMTLLRFIIFHMCASQHYATCSTY